MANLKAHDVNTQRMMVYYEEQLNKLGVYDTEGMGYLELKQRLTLERMKRSEE